MIRSSKISLKYSNVQKRQSLLEIVVEYNRVIQSIIDLIWNLDQIPALLPKHLTSQVESWLSARMIQCAAKQASGIVRGTKKKHNQRLYMLAKLTKEGNHDQAVKLQKIINKKPITKPKIDNINPELDSRFVKFDWNNHTSFDGWVTISSIGSKKQIKIPIKRTRHFNKLYSKAKLKHGIRISKDSITFIFESSEIPKVKSGSTLGLDIGFKNVYSLSNDIVSTQCRHGHTLETITTKIIKKKKGSKGFKKVSDHRKNYINWSLNQFDLSGIKTLRIENIKNLRLGRKSSKLLSHWTYTIIFDKINSICETSGVHVEQIECSYTSQRCSQCGWVRKANRVGKLFTCNKCNYAIDADLNAAKNISLYLRKLDIRKIRQTKLNLKGFYWFGQEPIVPVTQGIKI